MKPIKLTLQAFGPFSGVEQIDFRTLGESPLFLINGPTGSGKSSILDAICYALYGETTGSERTGDQMRCDYADAKLLTTITFEFELANVRYKITRSPDQEVPKQRGEGMTKKSHSAELINLDTDTLIASKPKQVATEVQTLIGLDVKQFRQVMVIPQGKFRELLTASSKERESIFGQLFQTQIYTTIERVLFERAAGIRKAKEEFDNQIKGALDVASIESEQHLIQVLAELTPIIEKSEAELKQAETARANAQQTLDAALQIEKKFTAKVELEQAQIRHNQRTDEIHQATLQINAHKSALAIQSSYDGNERLGKEVSILTDRIKNGLTKISEAKAEKTKATATFEHARHANEGMKASHQELFELKTLIGRLKELDEKKLELTNAAQQVQSLTANQAALSEQIKLITQQEEEQNSSLTRAQKEKAQLNELTLALDLETKKKQSLLSLSNIEASLQEGVKQKAILMSSLSAQETEVKQAQQTRTEAEIQWHTGQAALLAASLENGSPCPVCGSLDHPKVAESAGEAVTLDQVNALRDQEARANEVFTGYKQKQTELESQLSSLSERKQDTLNSLGIESTELPRFVETVDRNVAELTRQIAKLQAIDFDSLERQLKQTSEKRAQLQAKFEQQATLIADATNVMQHLQGVVSSLTQSNNTGFDNAQAVVARQQVLEAEIAQKAKALEQSQESLKQASEMLAKFESHLETLQKDLDEREKERINAQSHWQSQLSSSPFTDENTFLNAKLLDTQAEELSQRIEQYQHEGIRIKEQLNLISAQIGEQILPDVEQLKRVKLQMEETYQSAVKQFQMHQSQLNNLSQVRKRIDVLREQNEELDKQYQVVGTLSDVANGRTGNKISLHRFVLGVLLDDVLIQASQRLRLMSKGRYDLKRKEARTKGNAGSGLDLIVEDAYTGKWRDVATLSGGESFMAALSLALGLSDVVQSYSGGIRLDTLFIDEGFGSLDPESLDLAVQTLVELQQSGRTIGIISHVSELKEQMPLRLDVHASRVGSTVSLVN